MQRWREIFAKPARLAFPLREISILGDDGTEPTTVDRSALLDALAAGRLKTLRFSALVGNDAPNDKFLRPKGDFGKFARGFTGRPFLKDHTQSIDAKGGKILSSEPVPGPSGRIDIRQVIELNQPWSIKYLLDGTIEEFSLGWKSDTPECSICNKDIWECWDHVPGKTYDGKLCELLTPNSQPLETSAVLFGAAVDTGIEGVSLSSLSAMRDEMKSLNREREKPMKEKLLAFLCLAATATDEEITAALDAKSADHARIPRIALLAELPENATLAQIEDAFASKTTVSVSTLSARVKELEAQLKAGEAKGIVSAALAAGKISAAQVPYWEKRAAEDPEGTKGVLAAKGTEVPTNVDPPKTPVTPPAGTLSAGAKVTASKLGVTDEQFLKAQTALDEEAKGRQAAATV